MSPFFSPFHREVARAIVESDQWRKALSNTTCYQKGKLTTPLRQLISEMPGKPRRNQSCNSVPRESTISALNYVALATLGTECFCYIQKSTSCRLCWLCRHRNVMYVLYRMSGKKIGGWLSLALALPNFYSADIKICKKIGSGLVHLKGNSFRADAYALLSKLSSTISLKHPGAK